MKKYDIQPTEENIKESLKDNVTGRNENVYQLLQLLNHQEGSWSIAINGDWGSGKTFFVKQCKYVLDCLNSSDDSQKGNINSEKLFNKENLDDIDKKPFRTIYYDAWENDNETDPIQSLLACIATSNWASNPKLKDTIRKTADIGVNLLKVITPKRGEAVEDLINLVDKKAKDYKDKVDLEKLKKEFYDALVELAPEDGKLIVFVDELDRCKPTYAIKVLERIKHYFSVPNITFIFSVDLSQLQNTVKRYYGEEFDGYHYLDRFFDLVINLPEPNLDNYLKNTDGMLVLNNLFHAWNNDNYCNHFCKDLIAHFSFSLRQINHFYLKTNSATYNLIDSILNRNLVSGQQNGLFIIYCFFLPLMCALNQADIDEFNRFIRGKASDDILDFLANNSQFDTYYKDVSSDSKDKKDTSTFTKEIYNALFNGTERNDHLVISDTAYIDRLSIYKDRLIKACSLLDSNTKLD